MRALLLVTLLALPVYAGTKREPPTRHMSSSDREALHLPRLPAGQEWAWVTVGRVRIPAIRESSPSSLHSWWFRPGVAPRPLVPEVWLLSNDQTRINYARNAGLIVHEIKVYEAKPVELDPALLVQWALGCRWVMPVR